MPETKIRTAAYDDPAVPARPAEAIAVYEAAGYVRIEDFGFGFGYPDVLSYAKKL